MGQIQCNAPRTRFPKYLKSFSSLTHSVITVMTIVFSMLKVSSGLEILIRNWSEVMSALAVAECT